MSDYMQQRWHGTDSKVKALTREFERNHPFGEIFPARLEDSEGNDILQTYLERCAALRATRDTQAIRASNANTLLFIDALRGHL
jgi:hypothetical protein